MRPHERFFEVRDQGQIGQIGRIIHLQHLAIGLEYFVDDARIGRDDVHVPLSPQAFLDDFHVQQAEKPTAKPEPQCRRAFRLILEGGIVELQLRQGCLQMLVIR